LYKIIDYSRRGYGLCFIHEVALAYFNKIGMTKRIRRTSLPAGSGGSPLDITMRRQFCQQGKGSMPPMGSMAMTFIGALQRVLKGR
jgi:hypothetical protein